MLEKELCNACKDDPSSIFNLIKEGKYELAYNLVNKNIVNINTVDGVGNDIVTRFLKVKQYNYVIELMKKKNWNVNNQNYEGNTFGHILAQDNSIMAGKVAEQLTKKSNYMPNIRNKKGESAMDIALSNNYLCTAFKLLEDKRFTEIDVFVFKNLFNATIHNKDYGKYSKITNLEIIVENLEKKELSNGLKRIIDNIVANMEVIKWDLMNNKSNVLESIINTYA
jgi:hypothetical protein